MHDAIYKNQAALGLPLLLELAGDLGLSAEALELALDNGEFAPRVKQDFMGGVRSGVNGTPTFFINGHRHDGPFEFADLVQAIGARLMEVSAGEPHMRWCAPVMLRSGIRTAGGPINTVCLIPGA